ncbi:hypothetical protein NOF04DRAFT_1383564 [Fusarium oxysporum II5]|nr:hypothetical protein NOF04DRAFT_1383564 [Fusarium oxysporum II5]
MGNATCICSDKTELCHRRPFRFLQLHLRYPHLGINLCPKPANSSPNPSPSTPRLRRHKRRRRSLHRLQDRNRTAPTCQRPSRMQSLSEARANEQIVLIEPFNSVKKYMLAVIKVQAGYRVLIKGASEIMVSFLLY